MNAIALLQAAVGLLTALMSIQGPVPDDLRNQVIAVANEAIAVASYEIEHPNRTSEDRDTSDDGEESDARDNNDTMTDNDTAGAAPAGESTLEVFSPEPGRPITRTFKVGETVNVGAILRDANGNDVKDATVEITSDDPDQKRTRRGTSSHDKTKNAYFYEFQYEFKEAGDHEITFDADGVKAQVTVHAE